MTGRIPFGLLSLLTVLVCAPIQAQDQMGYPPGNGVNPAGFHALQDGIGQYHGLPLTYQRDAGPRTPGTAPPVTYEQLPDDLGFADEDSELGKFLTRTFQHAWFRSEYLQWTVSRPGSGIFGEQPLDGIPNQTPGTGGPVNVPISQGLTFTRPLGISQSPAFDSLTNQNSNGFRGTFGLPTEVGQFELSGFVLATNSSSWNANSWIQPAITADPALTIGRYAAGTYNRPVGADGLPATNGQLPQIISQAMLTNGVRTPLATTAFLDYDRSYQARLTTSAWGTEGNYLADSLDPNSPWQFRPEIGFRYFNFRDRLDQGGDYSQSTTDPNTGATVISTVTRSINSRATNNLFGPQIGARAEFAYSRILIGVEPKVMLGVNSWQQNLDTQNVLSSSDPGQSLIARGSNFAPMFDFKGYGSVVISKYVSAYCAYNYIWAGNVTRSYNDIIYNTNTLSTTPHSDFGLRNSLMNVSLQGISLGLDIRY